MTILAGWLLLAEDGWCRIERGHVRIAEERIAEVVLGEIPRQIDAGGEACFISPGFIDTHLHLPQFDSIGAHGRPLLDWLREVIYPAERRWSDAGFAGQMCHRAIDQMLAVGTTAFAAYATVHHASALAALSIARERQVRAVIGQTLMDREAPEDLCRDADQLIEESAATLDRFPPGGRVAAAVTPRFAIACSETLMQRAAELARRTGAFVQTHLAENAAECEWVLNRYGMRYTELYEQVGLLGPRTLLGHGIHLAAADMSCLSDRGAIVAHCPTANTFLRSGTMRRHELKQHGVRLSLGSDIGAGYERSMVRVARAMIEAASSLGSEYPDASTAFFEITAGNAERLGWADAGRLAVGNIADLLVIEPDVPWLGDAVDPLSMLTFAWDDRWLKEVWLRGRRLTPRRSRAR